MTARLPLFPLHAVLLPGAALGLRVFEPRYLDMVRDCMRAGAGFGVCRIVLGEEVGAAAQPAQVGTEAHIEDFGRSEAGLLTLRVRGQRRFRVLVTETRPDQLLLADIAWLDDADAPPLPVAPEHGLLPTLLETILAHVGGEHALGPQSRFDDAAWVSWRLAELLPMEEQARWELLAEEDPQARLARILHLIP
jgi:Lon protease-like protein